MIRGHMVEICGFNQKSRESPTPFRGFYWLEKSRQRPSDNMIGHVQREPCASKSTRPYIRSSNFLEPPYIINSCGKNHVKRYLIELDELNKNIVTLKHLELWSLSY